MQGIQWYIAKTLLISIFFSLVCIDGHSQMIWFENIQLNSNPAFSSNKQQHTVSAGYRFSNYNPIDPLVQNIYVNYAFSPDSIKSSFGVYGSVQGNGKYDIYRNIGVCYSYDLIKEQNTTISLAVSVNQYTHKLVPTIIYVKGSDIPNIDQIGFRYYYFSPGVKLTSGNLTFGFSARNFVHSNPIHINTSLFFTNNKRIRFNPNLFFEYGYNISDKLSLKSNIYFSFYGSTLKYNYKSYSILLNTRLEIYNRIQIGLGYQNNHTMEYINYEKSINFLLGLHLLQNFQLNYGWSSTIGSGSVYLYQPQLSQLKAFSNEFSLTAKW